MVFTTRPNPLGMDCSSQYYHVNNCLVIIWNTLFTYSHAIWAFELWFELSFNIINEYNSIIFPLWLSGTIHPCKTLSTCTGRRVCKMEAGTIRNPICLQMQAVHVWLQEKKKKAGQIWPLRHNPLAIRQTRHHLAPDSQAQWSARGGKGDEMPPIPRKYIKKVCTWHSAGPLQGVSTALSFTTGCSSIESRENQQQWCTALIPLTSMVALAGGAVSNV